MLICRFEVTPGQMTALLGVPGSGKSMLVNISYPRFYEVTGGGLAGRGTLRSLGVSPRQRLHAEVRRCQSAR